METARVFTVSRLTKGNLLFPMRIEVSRERVSRVKAGLVSSEEESITIGKVASVSIRSGLLWADVRIDSEGGSSPIISHGHSKADAHEIRDLIEKYQKEGRAAV